MRGIFSRFKDFWGNNRRKIITWLAIAVGAAVVVLMAALFIYNTTPHYAYKPINACDLLSDNDASKLISGQLVNNTTTPEISGNTASSTCSYTDLQKDTSKTTVLALAVRSAINEAGKNDIKKDFETTKNVNDNIETVTGVGAQAFFVKSNGQLNVLAGNSWLKVSYGLGQTPADNDLGGAVKVAKVAIANLPRN